MIHVRLMNVCILLACSYVLLGTVEGINGITDTARATYIDDAILEAKLHSLKKATASSSTPGSNTPRMKLSAFKKASPATLAQGKARLMFEDMVNRAESKILQSRRKAHLSSVQKDDKVIAQDLAIELLHKPGSLLNKDEIAKMYQESNCQDHIPVPECGDPKSQKHRTATGVCNNFENPLFGAADTSFRRLILPEYEDGIRKLRGTLQSSGSSLFVGPFSPPNPSARIISVGVVQDRPLLEETRSHILMQWGQFLDHDLDLAPEIHCPDGCAIEAGTCVPIPVPLDDTNIQVSRTNSEARGCHHFSRSLPACDLSPPGSMTAREQINSISSFIDGSQIYSSNETVMNMFIRDPDSSGGLLRVGPPVEGTTKSSLPFDSFGYVICMHPPCYLAGDVRVNEQTGLITMHTIWVREHNRIANLLHQLNPDWKSDKIFLVARDIVGAELQKITYDEYLPAVLGNRVSELVEDFSIVGYDDRIDPSIPNAFATAAYRFGHSQIRPFFDRLNENYEPISIGPLNLVDAFFNTSVYEEGGGTDPILRGLLTKPARKTDEFLNSVLTNHLFAPNISSPGLDLASLNIQRGRDHGLPPYLTWKRWALQTCGLSSEFRNELTKIYLLQTYGSFETVDLFVGGLAEEPLEGGLVGATFACIFSRTFVNLRNGDRFYYQNSNPETALFTAAQRNEIEKVSLSRVICDNSDNIQSIQPNAFLTTQNRVQCSDTTMIPAMDLNAWRAQTVQNVCYLKVNVDNRRPSRRVPFITVSRRVLTPGFHYAARISSGQNSDLCMSFRCPQQGRVTKIVAYPKSLTCSHVQNANLPDSLLSNSIYFQSIDESLIAESNGIYLSEESCNSGSATALNYVCNVVTGNKDEVLIQSMEDMLAHNEGDTVVDKDITSTDPLFKEIPEDIQQDLLKDGEPAQKSDDKLIGLLESVITELKTKNTAA